MLVKNAQQKFKKHFIIMYNEWKISQNIAKKNKGQNKNKNKAQ